MGRLDSLYARLPVWAQNGAVSAYGLYWHWVRFGSGYRRFVREYVERENLNAEEWRAWQKERISNLLKAVVENVPYYRASWNSREKKAALEGRLEELPLLEKEPIRADYRSFLRQDISPLHPLKFHTSGSTGTPISTIWTIDEYRNSRALREVRSLRWAGVSYEMPRATISGRLVEPNPDSTGPFHRFNAVEKQVYFSAFHLRHDTASQYVDTLRKHRVQWLTGYAVSYFLLAKFILDLGLQVPPLKAVITTSEKVTPQMREVMERAYGCRIFEEYSTVENAVFASECERGRLHISPDVSIVEILRPDGSPSEPGEVGEVVTTCFLRQYQPFIRYRLGDLAMLGDTPCPCGRQMPVIKEVIGRIEDVVVGPDGRQMVRFHGVFVNQPHIREGQIIQESLNRIRVKVVPEKGFGADDIQDVISRVQRRMGTQVDVVVEAVDCIPRTSAGKFRAVICRLSPEEKRRISGGQEAVTADITDSAQV
jgi:phenylacetate-CoA ligase